MTAISLKSSFMDVPWMCGGCGGCVVVGDDGGGDLSLSV